ncbi:MAG: hypothetical protein UX01_C0006G0023 [Candidatus Collierbacteria bacterium GW2011_GWB2_45_17]|uniref:Glycosyltransferase RgtA/B/C/D-like domain-containing protein n=1 Tax=Candidatus Collierbacteria bacterium GW2011_GWB2_45_17 TaxID=1618388 RepID=A0A837IEE1_9BACT|nr:MAG: hypothetical protein UW48_C0005G0070 [Microgenomates group bacterium GW2011_GWC1_44_23]KKT95827.1 MAG: hypothetical protein UW96_C0004G0070 [Candidatus Collierbacteria bacterium GW2011_GWA1_45_15]KKU00229.1 MAG: hypothetical protein UX01_C0006G0023 [Candidatus Collierbacteria bacterium GW2011_GWB2_45_17]HCX25325.1 hypothetical protein [Candidatus Collierbacteria bacterium]
MKKHFLIIAILIFAAVLRLYSLDQFPAGLNADEAAIGYNAWSLIQTGKDEHSIAWPLVFRSFDDYKLPVYFYLVLPFVKFLGLTVTAVRLPSALLGIASVLLVYLIIKLLFPPVIARSERDVAISRHLPLLSALFLALSPWHLQFSRGGWEVNAATFLILLGVWGFLKGLENQKYFYLFVTSFALSFYTYHSARIISPLLALSLVFIYRQELFSGIRNLKSENSKLKTIIIATLLGLLLSLPIASQLLSKEGQSRFSGVSIFADSGPDWQATNYRLEHEDKSSLQVRLIHNRYLSYSMRFVQNYLSHYSPDFLFLNGDAIARSKVPETGQSLLFLLPFFALGLLSLIMLDSNGKKVVLAWFLIAPLAASITYQSPHALRAENMSVPLMIIAALGTYEFFELIKKYKFVYKILIFCIFGFLSFYSFARYLHMYYVHYPKELPYAWQYGFDQVAAFTKENYNKYDHIIITDRYDQPYILIAFFTKYPPADLQRDIVMSEPDHYGFATGRKLGKYEFRTINYEQDKLLPNTLLITAEEKVDDTKVIGTVLSPAGAIMFKFLSTK